MDSFLVTDIIQIRRDAAKEDHLRTLGIRLLHIPNATLLEHPHEFVRKVVDAVGTLTGKSRK